MGGINDRVRRFEQAGIDERGKVPELVQVPRAIRMTDLPIAYAKTDAGSGNTLTCYLGQNETGQEIEVYFSITPASSLNEAFPYIKAGTWFHVHYSAFRNRWEAFALLGKMDVCG